MRWLKNLARYSTFSVLLGSAAFSAAGGVGCSEETFKCCECKVAACPVTDPATMMPVIVPWDPNMMEQAKTGLTRCDCPDGGYTYGECGVFCKERFAAQVLVIETVPLCACQAPGCGNDAGTTCYNPLVGVAVPPLALLTCSADPDMNPKTPREAPAIGQSVAKNSCSPGSPVGEN